MPEMSSARTFVRALQTRTTNTTRILEQRFGANPHGGPHPLVNTPNFGALFDLLSTPDSLSSGPNDTVPVQFKAVLSSWGLRPGEVTHIDHWPPAQRETVRQAMVQSIDDNLSLRFFWDLHQEAEEETASSELETGELSITFLSPRWKVRVLGPDNIVVDV